MAKLKAIFENPGVVGACAIIGALSMVLGVAGVMWDFKNQREQNAQIATALTEISISVGSIDEQQILLQKTLDTAIVNATAARKDINDALERRVDRLEDEHKYLQDIRVQAANNPHSDTPALESILQILIEERRQLYHEIDTFKENSQDD